MKSISALMFALIALATFAQANESPRMIRTIDEDITHGGEVFSSQEVNVLLTADRSEFEPGSAQLNINVYRVIDGKNVLVEGLEFPKTCREDLETSVRALLQTSRFSVTNGSTTYSIDARAKCGTLNLFFDSASAGGQALGIWTVARLAQTRLSDVVGLDFWKYSIRFVFPASGDYYTYNEVNITRGDHWDVVGHELGHAIYDQADIGAFGGGQHLIDACYSEALALSEGWASYFSAWLQVSLNDPDAKFEFMVPRRAPIRFENIPSDVCKGSTNEWRVTGFFWDLIDSHDDTESVDFGFKAVWDALKGKNVPSTSVAREKLISSGFSSQRVNAVWDLNFN